MGRSSEFFKTSSSSTIVGKCRQRTVEGTCDAQRDACWRGIWCRPSGTLWRSICRNKFSLGVASFIFCVLVSAGIAITVVLINAKRLETESQALDLAIETGEWFSDQLNQAIFPLFSIAQFAVELPIFRSLPQKIGPAFEEGSLPFIPPEEGYQPSHRNVTGICDQPDLVERFNGIASTIKKQAKMEGILVNLQLAPEAVVCLLYPLVNAEDFENGIVLNNTRARGLDLLTDSVSSFIAKRTIAKESVSIAGPLSLRQCGDKTCDATVEKAFIARLPIVVPDNIMEVDGVTYNRWGFATALINWEALVKRSDIYQKFAALKMEFQLTRTDRTFNDVTNAYDVTVVVLAETPTFFKHEACETFVTTALQTTNNEWEITVFYDLERTRNTLGWCIASCILLAYCISILVYVILVQRQNAAKMRAKASVQEASVQTERNMTAYFAHELRNPLGAIDSALSAMPDDLRATDKDLVLGMQLCTAFMASIMNNLLDVRKMEEGKMILQPAPMSLEGLVSSIHKMLSPSVKREVDFRTITRTSGKDWILADSHRIQQVMTNVITNAIKFTCVGSITIAVGWEGDLVKIECIDTGPGIPKEEQASMFERFVQRGGTPGGSGLGLAISKHIVNLMNGSIHFESDPAIKPGTNCVMLLPLPVCEQPKLKPLSFLEPLQDILSFLIIDDVPMNRMMLKRRFKKAIAPNCTISEASTGEEALAICQTKRFHVIIIDQYMEEAGGIMPGTDVVREMRRTEIDSIIIGSSGNEMDAEFLEAGADWVWQKPIPPNAKIIQQLRVSLDKKSPSLEFRC